jgi:hypothetical protein
MTDRSFVTSDNAVLVACGLKAHHTAQMGRPVTVAIQCILGGVFYLARTRLVTPDLKMLFENSPVGGVTAGYTNCLLMLILCRGGGEKRLTVGAYSELSVVGEVYSCFHTATNSEARSQSRACCKLRPLRT